MEERGGGVGEDGGERGRGGGRRRREGEEEGWEERKRVEKEKTQVIILSNNILTLVSSPGCLPLRFLRVHVTFEVPLAVHYGININLTTCQVPVLLVSEVLIKMCVGTFP